MDKIITRLSGATLLALALVTSPTALAQAPAGASPPRTGPASEASPIFQRHHAMAGIMKDMVQEMSRMHEEVGSEMTPEDRKRMAVKMKQMSDMMRRMSGWADGPVMREPEMRRQFDAMRRQMDEMPKSHSMGSSRK